MKKFLSVLLVLVMVLGLLPVSTIATESEVSSAEFGLTGLKLEQGGVYFYMRNTIALTEEFDIEKTSYETDKVGYPSSNNHKCLYITASATDGATIKAEVTAADNSTAIAEIPNGVETQIGSYVLLSGTNVLKITVSKEANKT